MLAQQHDQWDSTVLGPWTRKVQSHSADKGGTWTVTVPFPAHSPFRVPPFYGATLPVAGPTLEAPASRPCTGCG